MADTVVILGYRTYSMDALRLTRVVNKAREFYVILQVGLMWFTQRPGSSAPQVDWIRCDVDYNRDRRRMKQIDLSSKEAFTLCFCAKEQIDSDAMHKTMLSIQGLYATKTVLFLPPSITTMPQLFDDLSSMTAIQTLSRKESLPATKSRPLLLVALHFDDPEHWCGVVVDFETYTLTTFDPFQDLDRYSLIDNWVVQHLIPATPRLKTARFHFKRFSQVQQLDNFNCGVLVLLFFECCVHNTSGIELGAGSLQATLKHARYRYLAMNMAGDEE